MLKRIIWWYSLVVTWFEFSRIPMRYRLDLAQFSLKLEHNLDVSVKEMDCIVSYLNTMQNSETDWFIRRLTRSLSCLRKMVALLDRTLVEGVNKKNAAKVLARLVPDLTIHSITIHEFGLFVWFLASNIHEHAKALQNFGDKLAREYILQERRGCFTLSSDDMVAYRNILATPCLYLLDALIEESKRELGSLLANHLPIAWMDTRKETASSARALSLTVYSLSTSDFQDTWRGFRCAQPEETVNGAIARLLAFSGVIETRESELYAMRSCLVS